LLRRLALNDERSLADLLGTQATHQSRACTPTLSESVSVKVGLAALMATQAATTSYQSAVNHGFAVGVTESEVIDVLISVAPVIGTARVRAAAIALADVFGLQAEEARASR
jgi:alkylhydroperoxidase/carboxymuconolactone decarboxylase family protein YurZ